MSEQELSAKIDMLTAKVDAMYAVVEKLRKYFLWTLIITVVLFVVPLIGLFFAIPSFLSSYTSSLTDSGTPATSGSLQQQLEGLLQ